MLQMHPHYNPVWGICEHIHKAIGLEIKENGRGQIALSHPNLYSRQAYGPPAKDSILVRRAPCVTCPPFPWPALLPARTSLHSPGSGARRKAACLSSAFSGNLRSESNNERCYSFLGVSGVGFRGGRGTLGGVGGFTVEAGEAGLSGGGMPSGGNSPATSGNSAPHLVQVFASGVFASPHSGQVLGACTILTVDGRKHILFPSFWTFERSAMTLNQDHCYPRTTHTTSRDSQG
jgi:hypothetical protein